MCGICGKLNFDRDKAVPQGLIKAMADTIAHRGPDDEGYYVSGPLGLGFRRLSIIDLAAGHQPLANEDDTVWIVFNGEIYNYQELRVFLLSKGHVFKTRTDTEVIVHLYEEFGPACVEKLRGMFGFAIWDKRNETLLLARDRVGIKPIYYHLSPQSLIFGSEIKAILADPEVQPEVVPAMIDRFLTFYFVSGEETMLRGVRKLEPGCYMVVQNGQAKVTQYWDLKFAARSRSLRDAENELLELLDEAVRMHMIADVPVGFLLSGGVDSTAMLGMAVGKTDWPLSSYTLGFTAPGIADERPYARLAAERYGSEHHEMSMTAQDFVDFLPKFAWYMEEPCCEPQAIALYYVTRLAKDYVKVLISGEGGDEAFAGYPIYRNLVWLERFKRILGPVNGVLSSTLCHLNESWQNHRVGKYAPLLDLPFESHYYSRTTNPGAFFNSHTQELYAPGFLPSVDREFSTSVVKRYMANRGSNGLVNAMLYMDTKTSLPDDLLLKADKMTMANSVELRVPFLDHKFLEFAASLPENFKVRGFTTKYLAKRALQQRVPREILKRKKVGFPMPYESWMRNEMKDWIRDLLLEPRAVARGYFNRGCIERLLRDDLQFQNYPKEILSLVSLELWHRAFVDRDRGSFLNSASPLAASAPMTR
jgi:asparagine synthase (glutamine-hydrolysing)